MFAVSQGRAGKQQARRTAVPTLEALEGRWVPSTFTVANLLDSGAGSLRQAIALANASPGADEIRAAAGLRGTITLTGGELAITDAVSLTGPGADRLAVSGNDQSRVFRVAGSAGDVTIAGLTITRGRDIQDDFFDFAHGGGILNQAGANLTLANVVVSANAALVPSGLPGGGAGGGIYNEGDATLTLSRSVVSGNRVTGSAGFSLGGGLFNNGVVTITDSTFTDNQAVLGSGGAIATMPDFFGGGIGELTVTNSTFSNNRASVGGALFNQGLVTIADSQFTANRAEDPLVARGGAITNQGDMEITDSNFADNQAVGLSSGGPGARRLAEGGAIRNLGALTITSSALTGNEALGGSGGDNSEPGLFIGSAQGGAINNSFGALTITNSLLADNQAVGGNSAVGAGGYAVGGAIVNTGPLTLQNTTLLGNQARGGTGATGAAGSLALGGGPAQLFEGQAALTDVALPGNQARGGSGGAGGAGGLAAGGAISIGIERLLPGLGSTFDTSSLALDGVLISGNAARGGAGGAGGNGGAGWGGGLFADTPTTVTVRTSVITLNQASGGAAGAGGGAGEGRGGGAYIVPGAGVSTDAATRIVGNDASTDDDDVFGSLSLL